MNFATSTIMPLFIRFVIAAAMLTSGWVNCFEQVQIRPVIAEGLAALEAKERADAASIILEDEGEPIPAGSETAASTTRTDSEAEASTETVASTTRGVNRIIWLIHKTWPDIGSWGVLLAWTAAVGQLLAGLLLAAGLFTRIAAFTVCVATGAAVYIVSGHIHGMFSMNPFAWPLDSHRFIQLFAGLGLFTLSLGLFFSGGGAFALDHRHAKPAPPKTRGRPRKREIVEVDE